MMLDVQSDPAGNIPGRILRRICNGSTPCTDYEQLARNMPDPMDVVEAAMEALPDGPRGGNMAPIHLLVALDEPAKQLRQHEAENDEDHQRTLAHSWVETRLKAPELSGKLGTIMNELHDPEVWRDEIAHQQQPDGQPRRAFLEQTLRDGADAKAVRAMVDAFRPDSVELDELLRSDFIEMARRELSPVESFDPAEPSRIPSRRGHPAGAFRALAKHDAAFDFDRLFDGPEQLRTLLRQARPAREYGPSVLQCLIQHGDEKTFDRYAPVVVRVSDNTFRMVAELGCVDYEMDEQYDQARTILRYFKDRDALDPTALRAVAREQLTSTEADGRLLAMLYDFGLSLTDDDFVGPVSDDEYDWSGLTNTAARMILQRQPLTTEQHRLLTDQIKREDSSASVAELFQNDRSFGCQRQYERLLSARSNSIDRNELKAIARDWADNPDVPLKGADIITTCFRQIDLAESPYSASTLAVTLLIEAGWEPEDDEHVRAIYEQFFDYFGIQSAPGKIAEFGRELIHMGALPERGQLRRFENFVRDRLVEGMTERQKTALDLQEQTT